MKKSDKSGVTLKMRFSAVVLLFVFLSIPFIQAAHHHPGQDIAYKASSSTFKIFHIKCAVCDYLAHHVAKYYKSSVLKIDPPIGLPLPKRLVIIALCYTPFEFLFPKANSPPVI